MIRLLLTPLLLGMTSVAQAQICRPTDEMSEQLRYHLGQYSSPTSADKAIIKDRLKLGSADPTQITLVTSETSCKKARDAYNQRLANQGSGFTNKVYLLKVGTTYAVYDPGYRYSANDPEGTIVILDSRFKALSLF